MTTTSVSHLPDAVLYAQKGWPVFPGPVGKKPGRRTPLMPGWPQKATTDLGQIVRWWTAAPAANVCAVTGAGYVVLDVDDHDEAVSGSATLAALEREHGDLPPTLSHSTPSGGVHHFFALDWDLPTIIGWRPGLDILARGGGRCVLLPPSVTERGAYERIPGTPADIAAPPAWLTDLLQNDVADKTAGQRQLATAAASAPRYDRPAAASPAGLLRYLAAVEPGRQDDKLQSVIRQLRDEGHGPQEIGELVWPVVRAWPAPKGPWTEDDVERHLRSAFRGVAA
jgi:hypothetical protein